MYLSSPTRRRKGLPSRPSAPNPAPFPRDRPSLTSHRTFAWACGPPLPERPLHWDVSVPVTGVGPALRTMNAWRTVGAQQILLLRANAPPLYRWEPGAPRGDDHADGKWQEGANPVASRPPGAGRPQSGVEAAPHRHLLPPFRPLFHQELGQGGGEGLAGGGRDSEGAGWKRTFDT